MLHIVHLVARRTGDLRPGTNPRHVLTVLALATVSAFAVLGGALLLVLR